MTQEAWAPIPDWPGYEASTAGRVRSVKNGTPIVLSPYLRNGERTYYPSYALWRNGKRRTHFAHSLVLAAFVGPRPDGMVGRHLNDIKADNRLENLAYGTPSENARDAVANGCNPAREWTHCVNGHEFTPENTIGLPRRRDCRICARKRDALYRRRLKLRSAA